LTVEDVTGPPVVIPLLAELLAVEPAGCDAVVSWPPPLAGPVPLDMPPPPLLQAASDAANASTTYLRYPIIVPP
jgi:hypothetical protein